MKTRLAPLLVSVAVRALLCAALGGAVSLGRADSEESVEKSFAVTSGGTLVVDVEVGQIDVSTGTDGPGTITVWRKVRRKDKAEEEAYLRKHPVNMTQEGDTVSVQAKGEPGRKWSSS